MYSYYTYGNSDKISFYPSYRDETAWVLERNNMFSISWSKVTEKERKNNVFNPNPYSPQKRPIPADLMATILPKSWFLKKSQSELESMRE
jgi:hypothetical protein